MEENNIVYPKSALLVEELSKNEGERSIESYYKLIDLMHYRQMLDEVERMKKIHAQNKDEIDFCIKLGLIRRKKSQQCPSAKIDSLKEVSFEELFREAILINSSHIQCLYNKCLFLKDKDEIDEMTKTYSLLKEMYPSSSWTYFFEILRLRKLAKHQDVVEYFNTKKEHLSTNQITLQYSMSIVSSCYQKLNDWRNVESSLKVLTSKFPETIWGWNELGWFYLSNWSCLVGKEQGYLQKAQDCYKLLRGINESYPGFNHSLGRTYHLSGDYDKALEYYNIELSFFPDRVSTLEKRCLLFTETKDFDNAMKDVNHLIKIKKKSTIYIKKASLLRSRGETLDTVLRFLKDSLKEISEDRKDRYLLMTEIARYSGLQGNFEECLEYINKSIELNPDCLHSYRVRSDCYSSMSDFDNAINDYTHLISREYELAESYYYLGLVQLRVPFYGSDQPTEEDCIIAIHSLKKSIENMDDDLTEDEDQKKNNNKIPFEVMAKLSECYEIVCEYGRSFRICKKAIKFYQVNNYDGGSDDIYTKRVLKECMERKDRLLETHGIEILLRDKGFDQNIIDVNDRINFFEKIDDVFRINVIGDSFSGKRKVEIVVCNFFFKYFNFVL